MRLIIVFIKMFIIFLNSSNYYNLLGLATRQKEKGLLKSHTDRLFLLSFNMINQFFILSKYDLITNQDFFFSPLSDNNPFLFQPF